MKDFLQKFHINKKTIIIVSIALIALITAGIYDLVKYNKRTNIADSHVFVCDNPEHYSDFDNWLINTVEVDRVPMYIIIYENNIIGKIPGNIPEEVFTDKLGTILATGEVLYELPEYSIHNIIDESATLKDLASRHKLMILEISWLTCKDCIEQDENFTKAIYNSYSTEQIYRYYLKSNKSEVIEKYKD